MKVLDTILKRLEKFVVLEKEMEHLVRSTDKILDVIEDHERRITKMETKFEIYEALRKKKIE